MSWREDPDLVRHDDDLVAEPPPPLDEGWSVIFGYVEQLLGQDRGGLAGFAVRAAARSALEGARLKVSGDPEGSRQQLIEVMRAVAAALKIEPAELYAEVA
jgi:hypothetical protein